MDLGDGAGCFIRRPCRSLNCRLRRACIQRDATLTLLFLLAARIATGFFFAFAASFFGALDVDLDADLVADFDADLDLDLLEIST
jgi:hypothetical protein